MRRYWVDALGLMCDEVTCRVIEQPDWYDCELRTKGNLKHAHGHDT